MPQMRQTHQGEGMIYISCEDALWWIGRLDIPCCGSCHDDEEYSDIEMCHIHPFGNDFEVEVCCTVHMAYEEIKVKGG